MNDIEFRPITSTGGKYKVSQAGQVYGPRGQLKPTLMKVGYYSVALSLGNGMVKREYVHKLVAETFLGNIPKDYVVNHIDGDKTNNVVSNLEIVCRKDNAKAWTRTGNRVNPREGSKSETCPLGHNYHITKNGHKYCLECRKMSIEEKLTVQGLNIKDFKPIPHARQYAINCMGDVLSLKLGRLLIPGVNLPGYQYVHLKTNDGLRKNFAIHRLVYESFIGKIDDDSVIDHIDSDKSNNRVENLRKVSRSENIVAMQSLRRKGSFGFRYSEEQVSRFIQELRNDQKAGKSIRSSAKKLDISETFARDLVQGKKWKHLE